MPKLYSDLKILHFSSKINDIERGVLSSPIHIRLKPTNRCNHNCRYCCYRNDKLYLNQCFKKNDQIPEGKMKEIITDFGRMGVKAVTFSGGGEPLCYPYFNETVERLFSLGVRIGVLTNGSLLKGRTAEILGKQADWVRISMDAADPDTYARLRGVSTKEFSNICANIRCFVENKKDKCRLGVNFIVTKENCTEIYRFLRLMKRNGVRYVKLSEAVISTSREENMRHYSPVLNLIKKQISKGVADFTGNGFEIINKFDYFKGVDTSYNKGYSRCYFMQCMTVIGADLNIYACQDKAYTRKGKLGSIKNMSFLKLWFGKKSRNKVLKLNPNRDCLHHCTQHSKNLVLSDFIDIYKEHLDFV